MAAFGHTNVSLCLSFRALRVELYLDVNSVQEDKRVPVLLTVIGPSAYATVRSLVAPDKPRTKTYDQLEAVLKSHYEPKPLVIAERSKFYRRTHNATETVLEYAAELRRLAITCDFGTFLAARQVRVWSPLQGRACLSKTASPWRRLSI